MLVRNSRSVLCKVTYVANATATRFQVQWRRYRVRVNLARREEAVLKLQSGWRRFVIGRDVLDFSRQMATLTRVTAGCIVRLMMSRQRGAATVLQKLIKGHITRRRRARLQTAPRRSSHQ